MNERPFTTDEYYNDLVAKNCSRNGHFKHRNKLILDLLTIVGLRPRELCLLAPNMFMCAKGSFTEFLLIEEYWAFNGTERPVILSHPEVPNDEFQFIEFSTPSIINQQT